VGVLSDGGGATAPARRTVLEGGATHVHSQTSEEGQRTVKVSSGGGLRLQLVPAFVRLLHATGQVVTRCARALHLHEAAACVEEFQDRVLALSLRALPPAFGEVGVERGVMTLQVSGPTRKVEVNLDGLCISCHERRPQAPHGEEPIATTVCAVVKVDMSPSRKTVALDFPETLELKLDPTKMLVLRRSVTLLGGLGGSTQQKQQQEQQQQPSASPRRPVAAFCISGQVRRLAVTFGMPWQHSELPSCRVIVHDGHFNHQSEPTGQSNGRVSIGRIGAEGHRPVEETPEGRLTKAMPRLAPFLLGSDLHNLREALAQAGSVSPVALDAVPLLLVEKRDGSAWVDSEWIKTPGKGVTHLRIKAGGADVLWHFPTMHSLLRLFGVGKKVALATGATGRASPRSSGGQHAGSSWPLLIDMQPVRVMFLAGKLAEAPFALRFHVLGIGLENRGR
jgi:hypothetical protein